MAYSNSIIEQQPLYTQLPVGQEVIFVVSNVSLVSTQTKVKFAAEVRISDTTPPNPNNTTHLIGTFKTTPNNAGVGMFDFRNIIENYVSADNLASQGSSYKGTVVTQEDPRPLHLVDKYSLSNNSTRYMVIRFYAEYLGADVTRPTVVSRADGTDADTGLFTLFNGYLKYSDVLTMGAGTTASNFGYSLSTFNLSSNTDKFLTNAPTLQTCNINDYGTLSFLAPNDNLDLFTLTYYDSNGDTLGTEDIDRTEANGAYDIFTSDVENQIIHFGCFPGNLQNWSITFKALVTLGTIEGGSIRLQAKTNDASVPGYPRISAAYTININCPGLKGYESIRLCWLNQWGVWDYYTFTLRSTRNLTTQGTTYQQLEGSWNSSTYRLDSYKGGKKAFRVNATERISMNTDYVSEDFNTMFEELINSPEVYMLSEYQDTTETFSALNQYVTPVRLTTSNFTRKTIANDKLIQYTFEIEKSKTLRTQAV
tara:strand:+ start:496 stop:1935 length:1440 start_codon:yes stop_codon:yes gene_type:complete